MDRFHGLHLEHGWKSTKMVMAPLWYMLVCLHPDTVKVVLKGGLYSFTHSPIHPFQHVYVLFTDPKSNLIYNTLMPWLGSLTSGYGRLWRV